MAKKFEITMTVETEDDVKDLDLISLIEEHLPTECILEYYVHKLDITQQLELYYLNVTSVNEL